MPGPNISNQVTIFHVGNFTAGRKLWPVWRDGVGNSGVAILMQADNAGVTPRFITGGSSLLKEENVFSIDCLWATLIIRLKDVIAAEPWRLYLIEHFHIDQQHIAARPGDFKDFTHVPIVVTAFHVATPDKRLGWATAAGVDAGDDVLTPPCRL